MPSHMMPRRDMMPMLVMWAQLIGFVLLFLGVVIIIGFANPLGGCFTSAGSCAASFVGGAANAWVVGKMLFAFGLLGIGGAAGLKANWMLKEPSGGTSEQYQWVIAARRRASMTMLVTVVLFFLLLWSNPSLFQLTTLP